VILSEFFTIFVATYGVIPTHPAGALKYLTYPAGIFKTLIIKRLK